MRGTSPKRAISSAGIGELRIALALLGAALLTACSQWPVPAPVAAPMAVPAAAAPAASAPEAPPEPAPVAAAPDPAALADAAARRLLAFHERVRELPPADLVREQARLDAARAAEPAERSDNAATTLELALVLAQTRQNGDLARALALTEPLTRASAPLRWQPLARLLYARLLEQRRLEEQADRQSQQLRDQQRRIEQLNSQLEALKAIERSLNTRAPPAAGAASAPGRNPP